MPNIVVSPSVKDFPSFVDEVLVPALNHLNKDIKEVYDENRRLKSYLASLEERVARLELRLRQ